jgi:hypothetical protein
MTEAEWLVCEKSRAMLLHLGEASDRKLRLFAVRCWRRVWPLLSNPLDRAAVELAEGFIEGTESPEAMDTWWTSADRYVGHNRVVAEAARSIITCREDVSWMAELSAENGTALAAAFARDEVAAFREEDLGQAELLRDIFGNPFHPVTFSPSWRTETAVSLAKQMYDAREFGAMPILADALQDAGCDNEDILNHCRDTNQVHVRGCWVCDLVLGKE